MNYWIGPAEEKEAQKFAEGRQGQVVALVRTAFLKRFESSVDAFRNSCVNLLRRMLALGGSAQLYRDRRKSISPTGKRSTSILSARSTATLRCSMTPSADDDVHLVPQDMLDDVEQLDRAKYDVPKMLHECYSDLNQLADFLREADRFKPSHDDKLQTLLKLLKKDTVLKQHKCLIFTEFKDTAQYLKRELEAAKIEGVEEIDSGSPVTVAHSSAGSVPTTTAPRRETARARAR